MPVLTVPCLKDNYAYVLYESPGGNAVVVDPSDGGPILAELERLSLTLSVVLLTHHHWDHVGGLPALLKRFSCANVFCHESERARITVPTRGVVEGDALDTPVGQVSVLHVPGHTLGAVAYVHEYAVFTGDTLFGGGCGRLFEGTAAQMHASLSRLAALPKEQLVYSGHEYTLQNLAFAAHLEPNNRPIAERIARVSELRAAGRASVPSTLAEELETNPFLRCHIPQFVACVHPKVPADPVAVFAELRQRKDGFVA